MVNMDKDTFDLCFLNTELLQETTSRSALPVSWNQLAISDLPIQ